MFLYLDKSHPPTKEPTTEANQRLLDVVERLKKVPQLLTNGMENVTLKGRDPKDHPPQALIALAIKNSTLEYFKKRFQRSSRDGGTTAFKDANRLAIAAVKNYDTYLKKLLAETKAPSEMYAIGSANLASHLSHYECFDVKESD